MCESESDRVREIEREGEREGESGEIEDKEQLFINYKGLRAFKPTALLKMRGIENVADITNYYSQYLSLL